MCVCVEGEWIHPLTECVGTLAARSQLLTALGPAMLREASEKGDVSRVETSLRALGQSSVNACGATRWTALHRAASRGRAGVIRRLLAAGADPCMKNHSGQTALHLAVAGGHYDAASEIARCAGSPLVFRVRPA